MRKKTSSTKNNNTSYLYHVAQLELSPKDLLLKLTLIFGGNFFSHVVLKIYNILLPSHIPTHVLFNNALLTRGILQID